MGEVRVRFVLGFVNAFRVKGLGFRVRARVRVSFGVEGLGDRVGVRVWVRVRVDEG